MIYQLRGVGGGAALSRVEVGKERRGVDGGVVREGAGEAGESLIRLYIQPEENMADFRSVVSQGLFGSA